MTSPFHPTSHTPEEIQAHEEQRITEHVINLLEGTRPTLGPYQGRTNEDLARYYVQRTKLTADVGWGDLQTILDIKHYANEVGATIANNANNWYLNSRGGPGGWNNLPLHARKTIEALRTRATPVVELAAEEFDQNRILARSYERLESAHLDRVEVIETKSKQQKDGASNYMRAKRRKQEVEELQAVLDSMAVAVRQWEVEVIDACTAAGF